MKDKELKKFGGQVVEWTLHMKTGIPYNDARNVGAEEDCEQWDKLLKWPKSQWQ